MTEPPLDVSPGEISARPRRVGHRWFDLAVALSAICISVVSLIVAMQNGRTERDLVEASSWPFLQVTKEFHDDGGFALSLANEGVGPAKVHSVAVLYQGERVPSVGRLAEICCAAPGDSRAAAMARLGGQWGWRDANERVVRPGQTLEVFTYTPPADAVVARTKLRAVLEGLRFEGCYCSVFDRCFWGDLMTLRPKAVGVCPVAVGVFGRGE